MIFTFRHKRYQEKAPRFKIQSDFYIILVCILWRHEVFPYNHIIK